MSSNIVSHGGILPSESSAVPGIDIFGFTSGSPLPPPSPAPPTTNNTQYSLLGGTTPSTVSSSYLGKGYFIQFKFCRTQPK